MKASYCLNTDSQTPAIAQKKYSKWKTAHSRVKINIIETCIRVISSVTNHLVILIPKHPTGHIRSDSQSVLKEKSLSLEEISETNMVIRFDAYYNYLPLSLATEAFSFPNFS